MDTGIIENNKTQMRRGVLEYSILLILASGDEYASSIIQKLKDVNIIVAEGTTYPLLIRLKKLGLLTYRWEESPQGPPRKYYMITELGKAQLAGLDAGAVAVVPAHAVTEVITFLDPADQAFVHRLLGFRARDVIARYLTHQGKGDVVAVFGVTFRNGVDEVPDGWHILVGKDGGQAGGVSKSFQHIS